MDTTGWEQVRQALRDAGSDVVTRMHSLEKEIRSLSGDKPGDAIVPVLSEAFALYAALLTTMLEAGARGNYTVVLTLKCYLEALLDQYRLSGLEPVA